MNNKAVKSPNKVEVGKYYKDEVHTVRVDERDDSGFLAGVIITQLSSTMLVETNTILNHLFHIGSKLKECGASDFEREVTRAIERLNKELLKQEL